MEHQKCKICGERHRLGPCATSKVSSAKGKMNSAPVPAGAAPSLAKATKDKAGAAGLTGSVRRSSTGAGLRVGEVGADQPATSEFMGVTAGETAHSSIKRRAPRGTFDRAAYQREYMRKKRAAEKAARK